MGDVPKDHKDLCSFLDYLKTGRAKINKSSFARFKIDPKVSAGFALGNHVRELVNENVLASSVLTHAVQKVTDRYGFWHQPR